jgi:hypothetical protein
VETLQRAARESYRLRPALSSSIDLILATILQTLRALGEAFKEVDKAIEKEFQAFPNTLQSIQGIGPVYSAGIFSEIGDIRPIPTPKMPWPSSLALTWKQYQSGNFEAEETHMSKTGNEYLRYYLIEASNALRVHNAEYKPTTKPSSGGYQTPTQKGPCLNRKKAGKAGLCPPQKGPALQSKLPAGGLDGIFSFQRANWLTPIF